MNQIVINSPVGKLKLVEVEGYLTECGFSKNRLSDKTDSAVLKRAVTQLDEYFAGKRKKFELPLRPKGTEFQKSVWKALTKISYAKTKSYKQVAEAVKNPKASRAIGMANNKNPIAIIIPCHRVIGASGKLVGYAGGLGTKEKLLNLESEL